ncbi:MAG: AAA family ATPase [Alphaproteobacteria bacterium]|nr:AAA family ATPase [Alphaproteobacteria bacterium]
MNCKKCGGANPERAKFCVECGTALAARCAACGTDLPPAAKFCLECGAKADGAARPAPTSPPRETPKHLADKIRQSKAAVEGERKQVTVLFADVKGSMELAESLDPEAFSKIMSRFFAILTEGVERFEGFVDKFTGDGIMALFGAPIAHEDHAQRACYAALHLKDEIARYATELKREHGLSFSTRMGLNSGEVVVGSISEDLRMDYTAQGHTVGLAQRMENLAEPNTCFVSANTAALARGYFDLEDMGEFRVKGVSHPMRVHRLNGMGNMRTRLDVSRSRGLSRFVGRERDMAVLTGALERARSGGGQVVGVVADAGTGKSRLCAEFLDGCRAQGIQILAGHGVAHGKSVPMLPMLELWRAFYGITDDDKPETARAKIAGRLLLMDEGFRDVLPLLFDVFGVPDPANPSPAMDPEQRQKRINGVVKRILHDPNYTGGTRVILMEDLHWFDGASDAFLETFVESVPATRDLWLLNFRPEYQARWMQRSYYQHFALQPLAPDAIRQLLHTELGNDASVAKLPEMIHTRTAGNPFFIEEVVQTLIEGGHLTGTRGAYRLATPVDALDVPPTVQAVLAARIDRLGEREKHVLQTAAVIGKTFSEPLLTRVIGSINALGETVLTQALSTLIASEFLFEAALYPEVQYSFKHPLTQEVAARSQLRDRKARVHAAVAQALEEAAGNLDERAADIAQHWAEAGDRGRAARWHRRAAEWAGLSDPREGLRHWRRVRELARGISDERERNELSLHACFQLLTFGWRIGGTEEEAATVYEEGRALAESLGDRRTLAMLVGLYGLVRVMVAGSAHDYVRYGVEGALLAEDGDAALRAAVGTFPAFGHYYSGKGQPALEWAARVLEATGSDNALGKDLTGYGPRVGMAFVRSIALCRLGHLKEAWRVLEEGERVAEEMCEREVSLWLKVVRSLLSDACGLSQSTLEHGRRGFDMGEKLGSGHSRVVAHFCLGVASMLAGQPAEAREFLSKGAAISQDGLAALGELPQVLCYLSRAQLALGERTEALTAARKGIELGSAGGCYYFEAQAQLALAAALMAADGEVPRTEIEAALARAEQLVDAIEGRSLSPQILEQRGRLAAACGDAAGATRLLHEALDLYRAIAATGHAERLERELNARRPAQSVLT